MFIFAINKINLVTMGTGRSESYDPRTPEEKIIDALKKAKLEESYENKDRSGTGRSEPYDPRTTEEIIIDALNREKDREAYEHDRR